MATYPFMEMSDRISFIRKSCGNLSQEEFANRLGLTKSAISGYETGRRIPPDSVLKHIAREFYLDEDWLKHGNGEPFFPTPSDALEEMFEQFECQPFERAFLTAYLYLEEKDRNAFCSYLKRLFADTAEIMAKQEDFNKATVPFVEMETAEISREQKTPTPVSEDGQDDMERYLKASAKIMNPVQGQMFLEHWRTLSEQQKEPSTASDPLAIDNKLLKSELPDQS